MTSQEAQKEITGLEAEIEAKRAELATLLGTTVEELDIAAIDSQSLDEADAAEVKRLVDEITRLSMRIRALQERLGDATSNENFGGGM